MPSKSKKQAKLMAAVAHNPRFAKKVGIPQSVGREFNDADRKLRKYADGGKVSLMKSVLDRLGEYNMWGYNGPEYKKVIDKWDPEGLTKEELNLMNKWADGSMYGWRMDDPNIGRMDELIKKYGIRPTGFETYRGLELPTSLVEDFKPGDFISTFRQQSTSMAEDVADDFRHHGVAGKDYSPVLLRIAPSQRKVLPIPQSGQSELVMPAGEAGKVGINKVRSTRRGYEVEVDPVPHPGFAGGGEVLPSSKDEEEPWTDTYLKRPLSGLASMWGGTDPETGEFVSPAWHNLKRAWGLDERRRQGLPDEGRASLGLVDETLSLPALGGIVGLPVPEFAEHASDRSDMTRASSRAALDLDAPHGFRENIAESAGVMAGQLPVPAAWANKLKLLKESGKLGKVGKVLGPAAEWFSPTVVPKAANYLKGTMFGGTLGGALDYLTDHMDEREERERNEQFISEAMAEVLAEEMQGEGTDEDIDEALAELGYAEGGRVKTARKAITSLRAALSETDPEDVATRKAKIDAALHALRGTAGPSEIERKHLQTVAGGLSDAAADPVPVRRKQRFGDYERSALGLLEDHIAPSLVERAVPAALPAAPPMAPPPARPAPLDDTARGMLTQEQYDAAIKRLGFAAGGEVGAKKRNMEIPAPQSQKVPIEQVPAIPTVPTAATTAATDPRGSPLSQKWYENYGAGPEHLFLGDRTIKLHDMWGPQHPGAVPPTQQAPNGSWLPAAGIVGLSMYDEWKKKRAQGQDTSQQAFWQDMHNSAANTSDTDAWVNQQLDQYGNSAPIPHMNEDGSISYIEPNKFWQDMHDSAVNTSDTDAWVNQQLDDYSTGMARPVINDDGTVSYVDKDGNPVESGSGLNLGRAWQGAGGAYDVYSGLEQGGVEGYAQALQGANDLYGSYTGAGTGALGTTAGTVSGLADMYSGVQQGGVQGYTQAAGGALQTANQLGYGSSAAGAVAGKAIPVVAAATGAYNTYNAAKVGDKKSAVTQGAATGAAIGSIIPGIGTAVGAVVGAVVGLIGASLGNKEQASEAYYGAHKKLAQDQQIRGWGEDQVNGAVFETIKSHTKSGNINKNPDVSEMYTAFGITKDAHKNYRNIQNQMGDFIKGVIGTAQQMGSLPTDPTALRQLDGQQIYYKVVVPALAAKYKEQTGKDSTAWSTDKINPASSSQMQNLFADWTDWMTSHWGQTAQPAPQSSATQGGSRIGGSRVLERARGGRVHSFEDNPRSGAYSLLY